MRKIHLQPEPDGFDKNIRQKGNAWLNQQAWFDSACAPHARQKTPKNIAWKALWTMSLDDLHRSYKGVCAYLGVYIPPFLGAKEVDHFLPKSQYPQLAFEWSNYRLAARSINQLKGSKTGILDPAAIPAQAFYINFADGGIYPSPSLDPQTKGKAEKTIQLLRLNDSKFMEMRLAYFDNYRKENWAPQYMERQAPFIWEEMARQNLTDYSSSAE